MATYADGTKEYRLSDKVGNLYNDPDKKLRKYLEGGRIEKSGEWTFKYDKDGQLIEKFRGKSGFFSAKKDCWEYSWSQNGTLKGVFAPHRHGHWTSFTYDALGRRLTKLGDMTFHYLWNGNVPLHEWQTGNRYVGSVLTPYSEDFKTWLFEEESFVPLALIQDGKAYSIVCDQLGTPTEAYDEEGKEVWYRRLDMNGKILEETQPGLNPEGYVSIPFLFQGQYYDYETGLAYNRFRYYDPEQGRFISQDPIALTGGLLLFAYVQDPNAWLDLWGLAKSHYNGRRGEARARYDIERNGFSSIQEQVPMTVNGRNIIADFVAIDGHGDMHVFEAKFGQGRYTPAQKASQAFPTGRNVHSNTSRRGGGIIQTSHGKRNVFIDHSIGVPRVAKFHLLRYR